MTEEMSGLILHLKEIRSSNFELGSIFYPIIISSSIYIYQSKNSDVSDHLIHISLVYNHFFLDI